MKQYLDQQQTAKLIELGFAKPKSVTEISWQEDEKDNPIINANTIEYTRNYSIGELIDMLPMTITHEMWWGGYKGKEGVWGLQISTGGTEYMWEVSYVREYTAHLYLEGRGELIDALYDMIVKLKEEGII